MHSSDTGVIRVDTRCQPLVTALLLRDAAHLLVREQSIPGRLDLPGIGLDDIGIVASAVSTQEWTEWWNDLVQSISAGDLTTANTGTTPALISLIDQLGELDATAQRAWELERVDAAEAFARLSQASAELVSRWPIRSNISVCVLPVADESPLSARGVLFVPLRVLRSASLTQIQDLISPHLASD